MGIAWKKRWIAALAAGALALSSAGAGCKGPGPMEAMAASGESAVYVDAENGDDANAGTPDAPVRTLGRAQELARGLIEDMTGDVTVYLRGGRYMLEAPLELDVRDSGKNGFDVIWTSCEGEEAEIIGGTQITGWTLHDAEKNIWSAPAKGVIGRDFYVDGELAVRAKAETLKALEVDNLYRAVLLYPDGIPESFARPQDLEILARAAWRTYVIHVSGVSSYEEYPMLECTPESWDWTVGISEPEASEILSLENAYELLDMPGEWYLNRDEETIYYVPKEGQDMGSADAVLGRLDGMFRLNGAPEAVVEHIAFKNLAFRYTTWLEADSPRGLHLDGQPIVVLSEDGVRKHSMDYPGVLRGSYLDHITVEGCRFENLGCSAITFLNGIKNTRIAGNRAETMEGAFLYLGGIQTADYYPGESDQGPVRLTENNEVTDNYIKDVCRTYGAMPAICLGHVARTRVEHNSIINLPSGAIAMGFIAMGQEAFEEDESRIECRDNSISYNYIENAMSVMYDGGAIGISPRYDGSKLVGNYINKSGCNGLYFDLYSYGFTVTGNVFEDCWRNYQWDGNHLYIYDNYAKEAAQKDLITERPIDGVLDNRFENNYMWDEAAVEAIRAEAGIRWDAGAQSVGTAGAGLSVPGPADGTAASGEPAVYVDAENGDDANAGTPDAPVRTLGRAQELARGLIEDMTGDVTVYLRGGRYTLEDTLTFDARDSGKNGFQVIWTSCEGEKAEISGGTQITGWTLHDAEKNIWSAPAQGLVSRDFYVDGETAVRARADVTAVDVDGAYQTILADPEGLPESFAKPWELDVGLKYNGFTWNIAHVESVEEMMGYTAIKCTKASFGGDVESKNVKFIENAYELLDEPGEWYLDTEQDRIYYMPKDGQDMEEADAVLGRLETFFMLLGTADSVVENIAFEDLTFCYTTWLLPYAACGLRPVQSSMLPYGMYVGDESGYVPEPYSSTIINGGGIANWIPPTASSIYGEFVTGIRFSGDTFRNLGNGAVHLGRATKNSVVAGNTFRDLGIGAVVLGGFDFYGTDHFPLQSEYGLKALSENNTISDNEIKDVGRVNKNCSAILVGFCARTTVDHNEVRSFPYTGISVGWGWAVHEFRYDEFVLGGNSISYNILEDGMNGPFEDGGAIYTLGRQDGSVITGNYIDGLKGKSIYLDEGSYGFTITGNVVRNATLNFSFPKSHNYISQNYCGVSTETLEGGNDPWVWPVHERYEDVEGIEDYVFEDNDLWDEAAVEAIRLAAGVRRDAGGETAGSEAGETAAADGTAGSGAGETAADGETAGSVTGETALADGSAGSEAGETAGSGTGETVAADGTAGNGTGETAAAGGTAGSGADGTAAGGTDETAAAGTAAETSAGGSGDMGVLPVVLAAVAVCAAAAAVIFLRKKRKTDRP